MEIRFWFGLGKITEARKSIAIQMNKNQMNLEKENAHKGKKLEIEICSPWKMDESV